MVTKNTGQLNGVNDTETHYDSYWQKSTSYEYSMGTHAFDREVGITRYDEIPVNGENRWHMQAWFPEPPENLASNDYPVIGDWVWYKARVQPTTAPNGTVIAYPYYLKNPKPRPGQTSYSKSFSVSVGIGPFSLGASASISTDPLLDFTGNEIQELDAYTWDMNIGGYLPTSQVSNHGVRFTVAGNNMNPSTDYQAAETGKNMEVKCKAQYGWTYSDGWSSFFGSTPKRQWFSGADFI